MIIFFRLITFLFRRISKKLVSEPNIKHFLVLLFNYNLMPNVVNLKLICKFIFLRQLQVSSFYKNFIISI
ncbi:hypothetical protein wTkk_000334 [Wolbachia endosymbiont of Trichogramma kaykai]